MFLLFRLVRRLIALVVLLLVVGALVVAGRVWWVGRQDDTPRSDVILVLGASQFNGRPSVVLRSRLDHARLLYTHHVAPRILTVGGSQPGDRFTEGASGARYLRSVGVPAAATVPVGQGNDTLVSLRAAAVVMRRHHWRTAVVVTDRWHSLRSRTIARDERIDAVTSPTPNGPGRSGLAALRYVVREVAAYVWYEAFHQLGHDAPSSSAGSARPTLDTGAG